MSGASSIASCAARCGSSKVSICRLAPLGDKRSPIPSGLAGKQSKAGNHPMEHAGTDFHQRAHLGFIRVWLQASRAFTLGMPFMSVTVGSFLGLYAGALSR